MTNLMSHQRSESHEFDESTDISWRSVLHVCCSVVHVCCSVLQCVARVLQCAAWVICVAVCRTSHLCCNVSHAFFDIWWRIWRVISLLNPTNSMYVTNSICVAMCCTSHLCCNVSNASFDIWWRIWQEIWLLNPTNSMCVSRTQSVLWCVARVICAAMWHTRLLTSDDEFDERSDFSIPRTQYVCHELNLCCSVLHESSVL